MKQVLQSLKSGATEVADFPVPRAGRGQLLIQTSQTLVSAGTERMLVEFGKAGWLGKARQQPEKVRMVLDKLKADGLLSTLDAVSSKLDQPLALGYCNAGTVVGLGEGVTGLSVGDRVVSNGPHAELVCVPRNLTASIPDGVIDEHAAFTVMGAIALQGIRLATPTLGEGIVVIGLGLVGLMAVQILKAHGCRVLGLDFDRQRLALAELFGADIVNLDVGEDPIAAAQKFSRGRGVDAVIIASSGDSNDPVRQAATMCRKRARIVLIGVTGLELSRADFYEKELSFQVSCSYGPGRYDTEYEEKGHDYPIGFVRWTEQRNFEAVLDLMAGGRLNVEPLISHRFPIEDAVAAYDMLVTDRSALGILLQFDSTEAPQEDAVVQLRDTKSSTIRTEPGSPVVAVIGAGNYAGRVLLPALAKAGAATTALVTQGGITATHYGKKFGVDLVTTDPCQVFDDENVNLVVVATRHDSHAGFVQQALAAGKSVFVEKPLCLRADELASVVRQAEGSTGFVMVGFNRRFSPLTMRIKELLASTSGVKSLVMTVNAGAVPRDHWVRDPGVGGGRIVGEACHFVDLLRHIAGSEISSWSIDSVDSKHQEAAESANISLKFTDGSIGSIHYLTNGHRRFPKERLEVFVDGKILRLDNFRELRGWGWNGFRKKRLWRQDKGQQACIDATLDAVRSGGGGPIPFDEIVEVSRASIELAAATAD